MGVDKRLQALARLVHPGGKLAISVQIREPVPRLALGKLESQKKVSGPFLLDADVAGG